MKTKPTQQNIPSGWQARKLASIFEFKNGLNKEKKFFGHGTPIINYTDVYRGGGLRTDNILGRVEVNKSELERFNVRKGDVFFTRTSETLYEIGFSAVALDDFQDAVFSGFVLRARQKEKLLLPEYAQYCFKTQSTRKEIMEKSSYTTRALTSGTSLNHVNIVLPPITEQKRIASVIETWDKIIVRLTKKLEIKKKLKRALSQKLLTGDIRLHGFTEEWKTHPLSFYVEYCPRPVAKPTERFTAIGIRSHCKGTFRKENFDPNSIDMDTLYELRENDLVVNITFAWEGAIAIVGKDASDGLVSHRFPTYTFKDEVGSPDYFRQFIQSKNFRYQLKVISPGGAGRNRVLSKKDFVKLKIKIPDYKEQCAIGKILTTADKEIAELESKLTLITDQKNYLLNNLITGTIRTPDKLSTHN